MSQYQAGSVAVTNGSATVTGTSTAWLVSVSAGDMFILDNDPVPYYVSTVNSDTSITLGAKYAGVDAVSSLYSIVRDFTVNYGFPFPTRGDQETALIVQDAMVKVDQALKAAVNATGLLRYTNTAGVPHFVAQNPLTFINANNVTINVNTL